MNKHPLETIQFFSFYNMMLFNFAFGSTVKSFSLQFSPNLGHFALLGPVDLFLGLGSG